MVLTEEQLSQKKCKPCEGKASPLQRAEILEFMRGLPEWNVTADDKTLYRVFTKGNFMECVDFINEIAVVAEKEGHHPDLHLTEYNKIKVELSTHAINGLSDNDFIMASKINKV